jgi:hypothetical protein
LTLSKILFELGHVSILPEAAAVLTESGEEAKLFLDRHATADWGGIASAERTANTLALAIGGELLSRYETSLGAALSVMTAADRSGTYIYLDDRQPEGDAMEKNGVDPEMLFGSFTSATGLALGEILLLTERPERLGECLASIEATAYATLLCVNAKGSGSPSGRSLSSAALQAVRVWHERTENLTDLGEAIQALQDTLELMGVRYVPTDFREE